MSVVCQASSLTSPMRSEMSATSASQAPANLKKRSSLAVVTVLAVFAVVAFTSVRYASDEKRSSTIPRSLRVSDPESEEVINIGAETKSTTVDEIGAGTTFLLGIFSMRTDKEKKRRQLIRNTYLTHGNNPRSCDLSLYRQIDVKERRKCTVVYTFVVGGNDNGPTEHTDEESSLTVSGAKVDGNAEEDVTYLNIRENMEDGKSDTWFKYGASIADEYGIDYIGKTDSDSYLNVDEMIKFVTTELPPSPDNLHTYGGVPWANFERSQVYMAGQLYFVSTDLAKYVGYTMSSEDRAALRIRTEDIDFGSYIFSSPYYIKLVIVNQRMFWEHPFKTEEEWKKYARMNIGGRPGYRIPTLPFRELGDIWRKQGRLETKP